MVPVDYNITIVCTASAARIHQGNPYSMPYAMQLYFNDRIMKRCGGREENKVCTYVIRNASKSDSGEYSCYAKNSWGCSVGSIQLDFKGI